MSAQETNSRKRSAATAFNPSSPVMSPTSSLMSTFHQDSVPPSDKRGGTPPSGSDPSAGEPLTQKPIAGSSDAGAISTGRPRGRPPGTGRTKKLALLISQTELNKTDGHGSPLQILPDAVDDIEGIEEIMSCSVDTKYAPILESIMEKHGDVAQESEACGRIRKSILESICIVFNDLTTKQVADVQDYHFDVYNSVIRDAERMKIDVKWLVEYLQDASKSFHQSKELIEQKARKEANIEELQKDLQLKREECTRLTSLIKDQESELASERRTMRQLDREFRTLTSQNLGHILLPRVLIMHQENAEDDAEGMVSDPHDVSDEAESQSLCMDEHDELFSLDTSSSCADTGFSN